MTKSELIEIIAAKQKHLPAKDVELARTISLSIKAKEAHEEAEAVQSYRSTESASTGTSLGDLLKEHIGDRG